MERTHFLTIGGASTLLTMLSMLITPGCQDLNAFVTGDNFYVAEEGTPRVEIELEVELQDALSRSFEGIHHMEEWNGALSTRVLSIADLGMRFYPILSQAYAPDNSRPSYRMVISIQSLHPNFEQELIEFEGEMPRIESWVDSIDCTVRASIERRREDGPPLVVGLSLGQGHVRVSRDTEGLTEETSYTAHAGVEDGAPMRVAEEDVLAAVEEAAIAALRDLIRPVDRDFALQGH